MYRIFIVEDDEVISSVMCESLRSWGFEARCASDFGHVIQEFTEFAPQLVLLDISLPFFNGYHWCSEIRKVSSVPIVFISSSSDNMSIIMAMNMGADDMIAKPFDINVLLAKVQALLRRAYDYQGQTHIVEHRGAIFNSLECTVQYGDSRAELTKNENRIMQALMEKKPGVVSRDALMTRLWECDAFVDENTLSVNVNRLRKKLDAIGLTDYIVTKKGLGYMVK